jgi:hypothetical protein
VTTLHTTLSHCGRPQGAWQSRLCSCCLWAGRKAVVTGVTTLHTTLSHCERPQGAWQSRLCSVGGPRTNPPLSGLDTDLLVELPQFLDPLLDKGKARG